MNIGESKRILAAIVEVYPNFLNGRNPQHTANIWSMLFADEPYKVVEAGLLAYISTDTKGFPPSPGQVKEQIAILRGSDELSEGEAWAMVFKALRNGLYGYRQEFAKLPPAVQAAVGAPQMLRQWAMAEEDEVNTVISSNFQRSYRAKAHAEKEFSKLPPTVVQTLNLNGAFDRIGLIERG